MDLFSLLIKSGIFLTLIIAWFLFIWKLAIGLEPQSPFSISNKIYFEIEDHSLNNIPAIVNLLLGANEELIRDYDKNRHIISFAIKEKLDEYLYKINDIRIQRETLVSLAQKRFVALTIMWNSFIIAITLLFFSIQITSIGETKVVSVSHITGFVISLIFLGVNIGAIWYVRYVSPLMQDCYKNMKGFRNAIKK